MQPALEALLGEGATGLSAATVSRLKKCWEADSVFVKIVVTFFTQPMLYCRVPRVNRRHAQD